MTKKPRSPPLPKINSVTILKGGLTMEIWQQQGEDKTQYYAFQLYCEGKSYRQICELTGIKSPSSINALKMKYDWDARRAAYLEYKK